MKHHRTDRSSPPFAWPARPFHVVLVEPEIPPNTGNIARLCAATGSVLHLVGPLGFQLTDKALKRAGLDYWDSVELVRHRGLEEFLTAAPPRRRLFSTRAHRLYTDADYAVGDALVFGSESRGLPDELLKAHPDDVYAIPYLDTAVRSLNLATAAGIVLYEALRQVGEPSTAASRSSPCASDAKDCVPPEQPIGLCG